ncbi:TOM1-like protein 2 isoform X2 [Agrilus planipennis]|uniref:TOM1-like protein 2 isoform X2 n=1 Tax=Agrilus planipennis TaxID=224129 RepID=A0A1W4WBS5_AGRPL|nr:TOM1-like protein 2 isoform X2 [Agrilus planipennis]
MSFLSNALGGNPFSSPVGSRIEQATDSTLASENWALNMEICDLVNETEDGPKDAIKAIRKRLQQNAGKNYIVVMYTLTVLETCVKNCGKRFHILVCSKDFIQELVKLIGPKNDPPTAVQEKVLSLIQSWADVFKNQPELSGVVAVYQDLINKGIEFPPADLDAMAPILTPQRSVEPEVQPVREVVSVPQVSPLHAPVPTGGTLTPEQRTKLQSELDIVQTNMAILGEMLSEFQPGKEHPESELELLQDLNETCHKMQERLVDLISKLSNDDLTAELLRINDDMNNLFLRYSRWEKNREAGGQAAASAVLAKAMGPPQNAGVTAATPQDDSLIDFESNTLSDRLSKLDMSSNSASAQLAKVETISAKSGPKGDDEFDMFAQSRNVSFDRTKPDSTYKENREPDQISGGLSLAAQARTSRDSDFDEMEAWLGQTPGTEESMTSSEFEKFLAERAAAAEALPTVTSTNTTSTTQQAPKDKKEGLISL